MLKDGQIFCDSCEARITKVTGAPAEGWPSMHNLCSTCFEALRRRAIPR